MEQEETHGCRRAKKRQLQREDWKIDRIQIQMVGEDLIDRQKNKSGPEHEFNELLGRLLCRYLPLTYFLYLRTPSVTFK